MAVTSVSVGPGLRAWMDSGLTHILLEGAVADFETAATSDLRRSDAMASGASSSFAGQGSAAVTGPETSKAAFSGVSSSGVNSPGTGVQEHGATPASSRTPYPAQDVPSSEAGIAPSQVGRIFPQSANPSGRAAGGPAQAAGAPGASLGFAPSGDFSLPPVEWPEPWRGWFAKITAAPVLWTYHELGADLTGIGRSQERSVFFKNLIADLGLPKGSSVFWPSAMPVSAENSSLVPHAPLFAAGLRLLMPRVVVVFGDAALEDMAFQGTVGQFGQVVAEGKLLVRLPGIEELIRGDAQRSSAVSLLRALFVSINLGK